MAKAASKIASNKVENKIQEYLTKYGIKPGALTLTFNEDGTFVETLNGKSNKGKWSVKDSKLLLTVTGRTADGALLCTVEEDPEGLWPAGTELRLLADAGAPDGDAADYAPGASLWAVPDRRETAEDGGRILYAAALAPAETEE